MSELNKGNNLRHYTTFVSSSRRNNASHVHKTAQLHNTRYRGCFEKYRVRFIYSLFILNLTRPRATGRTSKSIKKILEVRYRRCSKLGSVFAPLCSACIDGWTLWTRFDSCEIHRLAGIKFAIVALLRFLQMRSATNHSFFCIPLFQYLSITIYLLEYLLYVCNIYIIMI